MKEMFNVEPAPVVRGGPHQRDFESPESNLTTAPMAHKLTSYLKLT